MMRKKSDRSVGRGSKQDPRPNAGNADVGDTEIKDDLLRRVAVEGVSPEIDCGRYPVKRVVGDEVVVEADAFADGHDVLRCSLLFRKGSEPDWKRAPMVALGNDRWRGSFSVDAPGRFAYTVEASVDPFMTWRRDLTKRIEAGQDIAVDLLIGAALVEEAAGRAAAKGAVARADLPALRAWVKRLKDASARPPAAGRPSAVPPHTALDREIERELVGLVAPHADRSTATRYGRELSVVVDRERARFSAWYEFFPRSVALADPVAGDGREARGGEHAPRDREDEVDDDAEREPIHATLRDCEAFVPYIREMGFDVVYLPPIHPIGVTERKGPNNDPIGVPGDVGSPWAIGAAEGGHRAIHPALGDFDDFRSLRERVEAEGMELALDIAFQASPDHPYVKEHPRWFRQRPDGSIQYAENPPKKYQDIYPFDFESDEWPALWDELEHVMRFWIGEGVKIFRVDNPHTKPFPFWERAIGRIKADHPEVLFLSEAFTRPKIMYRLAKLGFSQSYTYFTWRNAKWEMEEYIRELTQTPVREYFRPNFWPNTPDILHEYLQTGGRPAFMIRLILAATLSGNYGIYGPAFELLEHRPVRPGSEEYLDSEKYQVRRWELSRPDTLRPFIARINAIRRGNAALQHTNNVRLHDVDNDRVMAYSKRSPDGRNTLLVVVTLDPRHVQSGWLEIAPDALGIEGGDYRVDDLLGGGRYRWSGARNFVKLDPHTVPAHVFRVTADTPATGAAARRRNDASATGTAGGAAHESTGAGKGGRGR